MSHLFARAGLGLVATLAMGLVPAPAANAEALPSAAAVTVTATHRVQKHHPRCTRVEPWSGVVTRCTSDFGRRYQSDLLMFDGIWAPHFEPALNGVGVTGSFFVYVGRTPAGWVDLHATLGGTITLAEEYGSYAKGRQRIALYDTRGRLVAWDWITMDWDW